MAKTKSRGYTKKRSLKKRNTRRIRKSRSITRKSMNLYYGGENDKIAEFKTKLKKFKRTLGTKMVKNSILKQHGLAHKYIMIEDDWYKLRNSVTEPEIEIVNKELNNFTQNKSVKNFLEKYRTKYWDFDNEYNDEAITLADYNEYVAIRDQQYDNYIDSIRGYSTPPPFKFFIAALERNSNMYNSEA